MTRQRDLPSIQYRSPNLVNLLVPNAPDVPRFRVRGAARLSDAYGPGGGVGGGGTIEMFETGRGTFYQSKGAAGKLLGFEETQKDRTRVLFDPDDFATPVEPPGTTYLPKDDSVLFLRIEAFTTAGVYRPEGPIMIVPPYDFWTTKEPIFTLTGKAPSLSIGAFPDNLPDTLGDGAMNFLLPAYGGTVAIRNLDPASTGKPLFVSFHPGLPPVVIPPGEDLFISGGSPEVFVASPNGNPWFSVTVSVVNSA